MDCPTCSSPLETGYFQSTAQAAWVTEPRVALGFLGSDDERIHFNPTGGATFPGHLCRDCKVVVVEFAEKADTPRR